ncbi:MAG: endopeptidase La [Myxococcales bacterium]|nr:endopeptidase La [Myxococcales bacterium]
MGDSIIPDATLESLPILALRNSVLFPASVVPVNVGRARSVRLIEEAFGLDRPTIGVVAQRDPEEEDPLFEDLFEIGTLARVLKVIRLSSGQYSVVLQGISRIRIAEPLEREPCMRARVERMGEQGERDEEIDALTANLRETARDLLKALPQPPREVGVVLDNVHDPGALCDLVACNVPMETDRRQEILETLDLRARLKAVLGLIKRQSEIHRVKREVADMVQQEMSRSQRELLLRQQMRAIRRELGESGGEDEELDLLRERLTKAEPPPEAEKSAKRELSRMTTMNPASAEYQVSFTYVEWIADLPWKRSTTDRLDVPEVRRVLDEDHHGLDKPKKRIVEYIAVRKLRRDQRSPILCFVGPPGVGKTSLGRSIARATGREFVRISLGGVQDEAEIRGHRRTYVGALPGRLITGLKKAQSNNPVFVLDEIDKMAADFSGDPASALLEALDPEQNNAFVDHYLGVPADLSNVLFVATANRKDTIPNALLDRMEVIDIPGYTREDKIAIARQFLVPRQLSDHGLTPEHLEITDEAIERLVTEYTHEAGVRQLSKEVAAICRDVAVRVANGDDAHVDADGKFVEKVLGAPKREVQVAEKLVRPGIATTLTWTPSGGEILLVESTAMQGRGAVHTTGSMGDILKESVAAAFTYIRVRAARFGLAEDFLEKLDVHVHLPKGAMPKDGPAMGLSILVSLLSLFKEVRVRPDVALTGEITLRGKVLKVEGLKPKCLAAHHAGMKHVVIPRANAPELEEIPEKIRQELKLHLVSSVDEALELAFEKPLVSPARPAAPAPPPV